MEKVPSASNLPLFGDLLRDSWNLFENKSGLFLSIGAVSGLVSLIGQLALLRGERLGENPAAVYWMLVAAVFVIATAVFGLWSHSALLHALAYPEQATTFKRAYGMGWNRVILVFIGVGFLSGLATLGGLVLLIVPGIIFGTWFSFGLYIAVAEKKGVIESLRASKAYVKGRTWRVFWRWALMWVIIMIIVSIVSAVLALLFFGDKELAKTVIEPITIVFYTPFCTSFGYLLYIHLKKQPQALPPTA